jgi:hypothetical protein
VSTRQAGARAVDDSASAKPHGDSVRVNIMRGRFAGNHYVVIALKYSLRAFTGPVRILVFNRFDKGHSSETENDKSSRNLAG